MTRHAHTVTPAMPWLTSGLCRAVRPRSVARYAMVGAAVLALAGCTFPQKDFSGLPGPDVIKVTQNAGSGLRAIAPDCSTLLQPSQYNKVDDLRMSVAFGCATYTNLANQVANPKDLVEPKAYAGQSADSAEAAVQRYRENAVTPLRNTSSTDIGVND